MFSFSTAGRLLCLAYLAGVLWSSFSLPVLSAIILGFIIAIWWSVFQKQSRMVLFLAFLGAFGGWYQLRSSFPKIEPRRIEWYSGSEIRIHGTVREEPDVRIDHQKITIETEHRWSVDHWERVDGRVLITLPLYRDISYGDTLDVLCKLKKPEDKYPGRFNISTICSYPSRIITANEDRHDMKAKILEFKNRITQVIAQYIPEPEASLLSGILYGARRGLSPEIVEYFRKSGLLHIMAVSGYNITVMISCVHGIVIHCGGRRKTALLFTIGALLFFVVFTGGSASVIRAGVMGMIVLVAKNIGRLPNATNTLLVTATSMTLIEPKILVYDLGFQLSFLATAGLVFASPLIEKRLLFLPEKMGVRENVTNTIAALLFTGPLLVAKSQFSFWSSIVANLLVLPTLPWIMLGGALLIATYFIFKPLVWFMGWVTWLLLVYVLLIAKIISGASTVQK